VDSLNDALDLPKSKRSALWSRMRRPGMKFRIYPLMWTGAAKRNDVAGGWVLVGAASSKAERAETSVVSSDRRQTTNDKRQGLTWVGGREEREAWARGACGPP
jgi:hypothetical protein